MTNKFDELAKELAQSVTRRQALKRFSVGLAGMALACFGLADRAGAADSKKGTGYCQVQIGFFSPSTYTGLCVDSTSCQTGLSKACKPRQSVRSTAFGACGYWDPTTSC